MSNKKLAILGIIAAGSVIWAVAQTQISNKPRAASSAPAYLIQGLETKDIGSITVRAGDNETTLKQQGERFVVVNKDNYPAETKQINDLITKCLDIQTTQFVTEKKENHETLGLTEDKARNVVKFFKPDGSLLTGVIIGNAREAGQGSYVRLATSDKVYVAPEVPWISGGAMSYIDTKLITADRNNIESVTLVSPDGQYTLNKKDDSDSFTLENLPAGKKLKDSDSKTIATALTDLPFTDVKKQSAETPKLIFDKQYFCKLKDSTVYTVNIAGEGGKTYITCRADFTETRPTRIEKTESEEELKKKEAMLLADDNAKKFNAEHQGWIYEIADWKAQNLTKDLSALLEDEPKPDQQPVQPSVEPQTEPSAQPQAEQPTEEKQQNTAKPEPSTSVEKPPAVVEPNAAEPER
jgi:hypothetical protein